MEEILRPRRQGTQTAERCVLYARVSSVRQEQDDNLARQTISLKEAAALCSYKVVQVIDSASI